MKKHYYILLILSVFSCKDSVQKQEQNNQKPTKGVVISHSKTVVLESTSEANISNWKEYQSVADHLKIFSSISANEALNNALQLSSLVKKMKDSIRPKNLINPSFRTRINVLENEVLRLKDMTYITAITTKEVNQQVEKVLEAFSATNSKINTVYSQLEVEKEIQINQFN
jgi:hypothetical protein